MTDYKMKIIEMINEIHTEQFIKMIYGFVRGAYREEKSRKTKESSKRLSAT